MVCYCTKNLVYVPENMRMDVLKEHHDALLTGHSRIAGTLEWVAKKYWFPGMNTFCENF